MFTGIIEATASILEKKDSGLVIEHPKFFDDIVIGSSIAVSGVCLTVTEFDAHSIHFDVVPTTLKKTKLGNLKKGDSVNLERAMRADGRFEGHIVQGHCEGVGAVVASRAPTPNPSPGPRSADACGAAGGGESGSFNCLVGRVMRGVGSLRYPARSTVGHARSMRKLPTDAEEKLWQALRGNKLHGLYFRRQRPVGPFIVDFYCEALKLAVEVDGGFHKERAIKEADHEREEYLRRRGIRMLRCTNEDVLYRMNSVFDLIKNRASLPQLTEGERSEPEVLGEGLRVGARAEGKDIGESEESRVGARAEGKRMDESGGLGEGSRVGAREGIEETFSTGEGGEVDALLTIQIPNPLLPSVILHGSITLDGVALTVAALEGNRITVAIIPHTLQNTTLGSLRKNDPVNIETDMLGRYILQAYGQQ